jgi:hypothetical protein
VLQLSKAEGEMYRRMVEANAQQAGSASVSIRRVDAASGSVPPVMDQLVLPPGCIPTAVHGGPMLGVNVKVTPPPQTGQGTGAPGTLERVSGSLQLPETEQSGPSARERLLLFDWQGNIQGDVASALPLGSVLWLLL